MRSDLSKMARAQDNLIRETRHLRSPSHDDFDSNDDGDKEEGGDYVEMPRQAGNKKGGQIKTSIEISGNNYAESPVMKKKGLISMKSSDTLALDTKSSLLKQGKPISLSDASRLMID